MSTHSFKMNNNIDMLLIIAVFILSIVDLLLGYTFAIYETSRIHLRNWHIQTEPEKDHLSSFPMAFFIFQVSEHILY